MYRLCAVGGGASTEKSSSETNHVESPSTRWIYIHPLIVNHQLTIQQHVADSQVVTAPIKMSFGPRGKRCCSWVSFSKAPLPQGFSAVAISIRTQPKLQMSAWWNIVGWWTINEGLWILRSNGMMACMIYYGPMNVITRHHGLMNVDNQ